MSSSSVQFLKHYTAREKYTTEKDKYYIFGQICPKHTRFYTVQFPKNKYSIRDLKKFQLTLKLTQRAEKGNKVSKRQCANIYYDSANQIRERPLRVSSASRPFILKIIFLNKSA